MCIKDPRARTPNNHALILFLVVSVLQYLFFLLYTRTGQYFQGCSHPHSHDYRNYRCSRPLASTSLVLTESGFGSNKVD